MSWRQTDAMQERHRMIDDWISGMYSKSELSIRYGVSRPTVDKWIERFKREGYAGLGDRSHAPHQCPHRSAPELERLILRTREQYPQWGARMIHDRLQRKHPQLSLPAPSTIGEILRRGGLITARRRRRPRSGDRKRPPGISRPNQLVNIDFKGEHRLGNGAYVYPLTVTDTYARYLLCCRGHSSTQGALVRECLEAVFREYGLPEMIRSDNGSPFASTGIWGLSRLNVWWMQLGIVHIRTRPGCPQDNAQHERFHRTLKAATVFPIAADFAEQQRRYDQFREDFNNERPHRGLQKATPGSLYHASQRSLPERILPPEYPAHYEVRKVSSKGMIRFHGTLLFMSDTLEHQYLGLEPIDDGIWSIHYYSTELGRLDQRTMQVR